MHHGICSIGCCLLLAVTAGRCWADGGVVRAIERDGGLQISAFTSPDPVVAGPVDISVLVQDAATGAPILDSQVQVAITPRSHAAEIVTLSATTEAATNKLFRACELELGPGRYEVLVTCDAVGTCGRVRF